MYNQNEAQNRVKEIKLTSLAENESKHFKKKNYIEALQFKKYIERWKL